MKYFSDSERGALPRINNEIPHNAWCGLTACIQKLIETGHFGESFPEMCSNGQQCIGTNEKSFAAGLKAEVFGIEYPFLETKKVSVHRSKKGSFDIPKKAPYVPNYIDVLDLVQFCYKNVSKPISGQYHSYFGHCHVAEFDRESGQRDFLESVNIIFSRNGLAYELKADGEITRILNPSLSNLLEQMPKTLDRELDDLIFYANKKICNRDVRVRYEALKELWDAFERIKTVDTPDQNKKQAMTLLLDKCSSDNEFREQIEIEAKTLTDIGNSFFIRHSEVTQVKLNDSDHIEYLFHRLASFLSLLAKKLD